MGYLLKEALKTLCGVNQWSYAVFWKIGCQNPRLLIWEECYCGPITYSGLPQMSGIQNPVHTHDERGAWFGSAEAHTLLREVQSGDRVQLLVNKMMMDNHVNLVGEGLVGRAAFTGNYNWIHSQNCAKEAHPPEVLNELRQQISAGMQTVAVIPALPHGVIQLGSLSAIMENIEFVNDAKSLILQLGGIPGALFSENYDSKEPAPKIGASICLEKPVSMGSSMKSTAKSLTSYITANYNQQNNSPPFRGDGQNSNFVVRQFQDNLPSATQTFRNPQCSVSSYGHSQADVIPDIKPNIGFMNQHENDMTESEILNSNLEVWRNHESKNYDRLKTSDQQMVLNAVAGYHAHASLNDTSFSFSSQPRKNGGLTSTSHKGFVGAPSHEPPDLHNVLDGHPFARSNPSSLSVAHRPADNSISSVHILENAFQSVAQYKTDVSSLCFEKNLNANYLLSDSAAHKHQVTENKSSHVDESKEEVKNDIFHALCVPFPLSDGNINSSYHIDGFIHGNQKLGYGCQNMGLNSDQFEDVYVQPQSADDLFDILGANFKSKSLSTSWNNILNNGPATNSQTLDGNKYGLHKLQNADSGLQTENEGNSDSGIFSVHGTDHLLEAVVSRVHSITKQSSDDSLSCRTTLTKLSNSSGPTASTSPGQASASSQMQEELFGVSKSLTKAAALSSYSFKSGSCKEDSRNYSQTNSYNGSHISSWVEQGTDMKCSVSASTAYSKKPEEISKSNRKRLKPGENPRPRPKDRQMIQDRVKELREIIPNGAKCSIDALLERTIKHMLFLQNVSKHADKLKQLEDPKIISKEGGLVLKDNLEGGATWAYEVGSQSMFCPIIVEDLNAPRQMLVEMLCEEQGLFLEIADLIRGLGLTILKGVMETQKDKIWARFVVEANRDVTRMEIFVSLVRLLEQTTITSATPTNCISNDNNVMAYQPLDHAATVSATGRACTFQ